MINQYHGNEFENIYQEIMYEVRDMMGFISFIMGDKKIERGFMDLLKQRGQCPANDNWPIYETKEKQNLKLHEVQRNVS